MEETRPSPSSDQVILGLEGVEKQNLPYKPKSLLPWRKVIPIYIALWCEAFNSSSIFSYVGFMILDFGLSKDEKDPAFMYASVGAPIWEHACSKDNHILPIPFLYYAGLVGSCYFAAQLCSRHVFKPHQLEILSLLNTMFNTMVFFWGTLSDRIGRRPILLIGQTGSMLASIAFGFSQHYWWAVATRSLSGLLNGTVGISKTYVGEICDSSNVAQAFGWIGLMWGFGSIAGSVFGGLLARPATKYPNVFSSTGLFGRYPYLIPNLLAATVTLTGLILCYMFLTENKRKPHPPTAKEIQLQTELGLRTNDSSESSNLDDLGIPLEDVNSSPRQKGGEEFNHDQNSQGSSVRDSREIELDPEEGPAYIGGYGGLSTHINRSLPWYRRGVMAKITQFPSYIRSLPIFQEWTPVQACLLYALFGAFQTMADEIWPLWALTPVSEGGLAFTTDQIGICNAWGGAVQLVFNLALYPVMARRFGLVKMFCIGLASSACIYLVYPFLRTIPLPVAGNPGSYILFWSALGLLAMLRVCFAQSGFSSIMTIISNSVYPETMGSANGLGQSMVAFTRMIAPFSSAAVLALSLSPKMVFPFNYGRLAWYLISCLCAATLFFAIRLSNSVNKPRVEAEADKNEKIEASQNGLSISISTDSDLYDTSTSESNDLTSSSSELKTDDEHNFRWSTNSSPTVERI